MKVREIAWIDPAQAFQALAGAADVVFLDSAAAGDPRAAFSYIGLEPVAVLPLAVDERAPFARLRAFLAAHQLPVAPDWPLPFKGGAVGWLGYDLVCGRRG